jgi:transposase
MEEHMRDRFPVTAAMQLLKRLSGVRDILGIVIPLEIGFVDRFSSAEQLASYAGTVPTVKSRSEKFRYGHLHEEAKHYLK